jgi:hypothetical protein
MAATDSGGALPEAENRRPSDDSTGGRSRGVSRFSRKEGSVTATRRTRWRAGELREQRRVIRAQEVLIEWLLKKLRGERKLATGKEEAC